MAPKVIPVKYFLYGGLIVLLAIALVFFYLYKKESKEKAMLLQKGIRGEVWVMDLYGRKTSRKSSPNYYMTVAFFADTAAIKPVITDTAVSKAKNGPDMVDRLFNKIHAGDRPGGNYQTLKIAISSVEYNKYKKDDKVKIIYLKDDLTVVKLLEQVE
jgi:hypothetical protein